MFQSPFGELKIGKIALGIDDAVIVQFQSPFGELKIGKLKKIEIWASTIKFQSPFGELKIGKSIPRLQREDTR